MNAYGWPVSRMVDGKQFYHVCFVMKGHVFFTFSSWAESEEEALELATRARFRTPGKTTPSV